MLPMPGADDFPMPHNLAVFAVFVRFGAKFGEQKRPRGTHGGPAVGYLHGQIACNKQFANTNK